jgi:hypothetical protein
VEKINGKKILTPKVMVKFALIAMKVHCNQFLWWELLVEI